VALVYGLLEGYRTVCGFWGVGRCRGGLGPGDIGHLCISHRYILLGPDPSLAYPSWHRRDFSGMDPDCPLGPICPRARAYRLFDGIIGGSSSQAVRATRPFWGSAPDFGLHAADGLQLQSRRVDDVCGICNDLHRASL